MKQPLCRGLALILTSLLLAVLPLPLQSLECEAPFHNSKDWQDSGPLDSGPLDSGAAEPLPPSALLVEINPPNIGICILPRTKTPLPAEDIRALWEQEHRLPLTAQGRTAAGTPVECVLEYDFSQVNTCQGGQHTLAVKPVPPEGIYAAPELICELPYYVIYQTRVDLSYYSITPEGDILFEWPYLSPDPLKLEYATEAIPGYFPDSDGKYGRCGSSSLLISRDSIASDVPHYFRVKHGGTTSNAARILLHNGGVEVNVSQRFPARRPDWADQDGGDREEQEFPPIIQPLPFSGNVTQHKGASIHTSGSAAAPDGKRLNEIGPNLPAVSTQNLIPEESSIRGPAQTLQKNPSMGPAATQRPIPFSMEISSPPQETAASATEEPRLESVTADSTTLSGMRIRDLLSGGAGFIPFEKHGIMVSVPAALFEGLSLPDDSLFTITIQKTSDRAFQILLSADGMALPSFPPISVRFPILEEIPADSIAVYRSDGNYLEEAILDKDSLTASFQVTQPGAYCFDWPTPAGLGAEASIPAARSLPSAVPLVACCLTTGGAILYGRKRK